MLRLNCSLLLLFCFSIYGNSQLENYVYQRGDESQLDKLIGIDKEKSDQIVNAVYDIFKNPESEEDRFSLYYRFYKKHLSEEQYLLALQILRAAEKEQERRMLAPEAQKQIDFFNVRVEAFQEKLLPAYLKIQNKITAQFSAEDMKVVDSIRVIFDERIDKQRERMNIKIKKMSGSITAQKRQEAGMRGMLAVEEKLMDSETLTRMFWPKGKLRKKGEYLANKYATLFAQYETELQTLALREVEEIFLPAILKSAENADRQVENHEGYKKVHPVSLQQKVFLLLVRP